MRGDNLENFFTAFADKFYKTFIQDERWKYLTNGLKNTLTITIFAVLLGMMLGFLIAIIRSTHDKTGKLKVLNFFAKIYLTVIRGTPVVVQLLIIYFVIFASVQVDKIFAAVLAFGLNSAAYVAEIVRSGIMAVDNGQFEAGRSLGFSYFRTIIYIIMPQAFKNVLPALANEFIVLLKETSVASFIAVKDMMKGANALVGFTYNMNIPYLTVALIYLILVLGLQKLVGLLERRLRSSDH